MFMNKALLLVGVLLSSTLILGLGNWSLANDDIPEGAPQQDRSVVVCVNWDTKQVRYSKYWEDCPTRHAEVILGADGPKGHQGVEGPRGPRGFTGSRGPAGATTSLWNSLSTCYQKVEIGENAGLDLATKNDREFFETSTGCVVEDALDQSLIQTYKRAGVPVVESVQFVSIGGAVESGGGYFWRPQVTGNITYDIRIANHLAISALGGSYQYCTGGYGGSEINQIDGNLYRITASYTAKPASLIATINIGFKENNYSDCNWEVDSLSYLPDILIHEDPEKLRAVPELTDLLSAWGW